MIKVSKELMTLRDKAFQATSKIEQSRYVTDVIVSAIAKAYCGVHPNDICDELIDFITELQEKYGISYAVNIALGLCEIGGNDL